MKGIIFHPVKTNMTALSGGGIWSFLRKAAGLFLLENGAEFLSGLRQLLKLN